MSGKSIALGGSMLGIVIALVYVFFVEPKPVESPPAPQTFHVKQTTGDQPVSEEQTPSKAAETGTRSSGLSYKVLQAGSGEHPTATDEVTVNYEGRLLDGTVFDSSYERGQPTSFRLNQVIAGWTEGLQLMQPGAIWELTIPADLAYGERGVPGAIPPGSTLVFKVELISINK